MADLITSANFKTRHGITTTTNDARIAAHITAATLEVSSRTGRYFGTDTQATARYFWPTNCETVRINDALEITSVALDLDDSGNYATTLVAADYFVKPHGGFGPNGQTGWPAEEIHLAGYGYTFRTYRRPPIKVTAKWGWATAPTDVVEACYLIAHRLYYEVAVPSGITAPNAEFGLPGSPLQRPYTVDRLLAPYVRFERNVGIAG